MGSSAKKNKKKMGKVLFYPQVTQAHAANIGGCKDLNGKGYGLQNELYKHKRNASLCVHAVMPGDFSLFEQVHACNTNHYLVEISWNLFCAKEKDVSIP